MALSLLSNCATQAEVLRAVSTSCTADGHPAVVAVTKLLSSQDATLSTKAATLVGNLCHDSALRSQVSLHPRGTHDITVLYMLLTSDAPVLYLLLTSDAPVNDLDVSVAYL